MRIACVAGFNYDVCVAAATAIAQAVVYRTGGECRMHKQLLLWNIFVAQHHDDNAATGGFLGPILDIDDRLFQRRLCRVVAERNDFVGVTPVVPCQQVDIFLFRQDR